MGLAAIKKAARPVQDEEDAGFPIPEIDQKGSDDDEVSASPAPAAVVTPPTLTGGRRPPPPAPSPVAPPSDTGEDDLSQFTALAGKASADVSAPAAAAKAPQSLAQALDASLPQEASAPIFS